MFLLGRETVLCMLALLVLRQFLLEQVCERVVEAGPAQSQIGDTGGIVAPRRQIVDLLQLRTIPGSDPWGNMPGTPPWVRRPVRGDSAMVRRTLRRRRWSQFHRHATLHGRPSMEGLGCYRRSAAAEELGKGLLVTAQHRLMEL